MSAVLLKDTRVLTGKKLFIIVIVFILILSVSSADTFTPQTPKFSRKQSFIWLVLFSLDVNLVLV